MGQSNMIWVDNLIDFSCYPWFPIFDLDELTFFEVDTLDNGIDTITEIELSFHIFDADYWDDILDTEAITITP